MVNPLDRKFRDIGGWHGVAVKIPPHKFFGMLHHIFGLLV
jgi:hypothetical protein